HRTREAVARAQAPHDPGTLIGGDPEKRSLDWWTEILVEFLDEGVSDALIARLSDLENHRDRQHLGGLRKGGLLALGWCRQMDRVGINRPRLMIEKVRCQHAKNRHVNLLRESR